MPSQDADSMYPHLFHLEPLDVTGESVLVWTDHVPFEWGPGPARRTVPCQKGGRGTPTWVTCIF